MKKIKKNILLSYSSFKEKGIKEFYLAAEKLSLKFKIGLIAGTLDYEKNNQNKLEIIVKIKKIKFLGYEEKMYNLFNKASIVCLPSYEGFPKSLIEASSSVVLLLQQMYLGVVKQLKKIKMLF